MTIDRQYHTAMYSDNDANKKFQEESRKSQERDWEWGRKATPTTGIVMVTGMNTH